MPPDEAFEAADKFQPVIITATGRAQIWGLLKLSNFEDSYLYVMRNVDSRVLAQLERTGLAIREYKEFESRRTEAQITFALVYIEYRTGDFVSRDLVWALDCAHISPPNWGFD